MTKFEDLFLKEMDTFSNNEKGTPPENGYTTIELKSAVHSLDNSTLLHAFHSYEVKIIDSSGGDENLISFKFNGKKFTTEISNVDIVTGNEKLYDADEEEISENQEIVVEEVDESQKSKDRFNRWLKNVDETYGGRYGSVDWTAKVYYEQALAKAAELKVPIVLEHFDGSSGVLDAGGAFILTETISVPQAIQFCNKHKLNFKFDPNDIPGYERFYKVISESFGRTEKTKQCAIKLAINNLQSVNRYGY